LSINQSINHAAGDAPYVSLQQEAQVPQRNSASAAHMKGARPGLQPNPLPSFWLHLCVWSNPKPATNVRQACRPLSAL